MAKTARISRTEQPVSTEKRRKFMWSGKSRQALIDRYVDTGDLETVLNEVNLPYSELRRHLASNAVFARVFQEAELLVEDRIELASTSMAVRGNDKLMIKRLTAKRPEYKESLKVDVNQTVRLNGPALDDRLSYLMKKHGVIEGTVEEVKALAHSK